MKKPNLQEVTCPHCRGKQSEPASAISTNCRKCGRYFKLKSKGELESRTSRVQKDTREVICVKCGAPNLVAAAAFSTQCIKCSNYIELGNKVVKGVQSGKFYAHDDVLFEEGCSFKGMEATGRRMDVRGKVFSNLRATVEIIAASGCTISGELHAPTVRIERSSTVRVQQLVCERLLVSGALEISGKLAAGEIVLNDGAVFSGRLDIPDSKLKIDAAATVHFDSITCSEFEVEGNVTLATGLTTEKLAVANGGVLTAPVVRASRVEVNAGGRLQALMEKYVPREKPVVPEAVINPEISG